MLPRPMDPEARKHFERGARLYEAGDFDRALDEFELGCARDAHPDFLYAMAQAHRRKGDCVRAIPLYADFMATGPPQGEAERARSNLSRCNALLENDSPPGKTNLAPEAGGVKAASTDPMPIAGDIASRSGSTYPELSEGTMRTLLQRLRVKRRSPVFEPKPSRRKGPLIVAAHQVSRQSGSEQRIPFARTEQVPSQLTAKLCIDSRGSVTSVMVLSPHSRRVRAMVEHTLHSWRYKPVIHNEEPVAACFAKAFRVQIDGRQQLNPPSRSERGDRLPRLFRPMVEPDRKQSRWKGPIIVAANRMNRQSGSVQPIYFGRTERTPSQVTAKLCIDSRGTVTSVTVLSPHPLSVRATVERALHRWRYRPVIQDEESVAACFTRTFRVQAHERL